MNERTKQLFGIDRCILYSVSKRIVLHSGKKKIRTALALAGKILK